MGRIKKLVCNYYFMALLFAGISWIIMSNSQVLNYFEKNSSLCYVTIILIYIVFLIVQIEVKGKVHDGYLLLGGFLLQFIYVTATPYNVSDHDLGFFQGFGSAELGEGHLGYIGYLFNYGQLPKTNPMEVWSYYNPPLFHFTEACWLKINALIGLPEAVCLENMQFLTMLYSMLSVCVFCSIMKEICLSDKARKIWMLAIAFHPFFWFTAAGLSNDALSVFFLFLAILYTIKWYKDNSIKNILILALTIGLGMMTKLTVGLIAPATAFVFLIVLWKKRTEWKKLFAQFCIFGIVCIPLGLWWSIRNFVKYDMPIGYVQSFTSFGGQDVREYSFLGRLRPELKLWLYPFMSFNNLAYRIDYGIPSTLIKTSLFCDVRLFLDDCFVFYVCRWYVFLTLLLFILAGCMFLWKLYEHIWHKQWNDTIFWFASIALMVQVITYIKFCFAYPNVCSADFRYVVGCLVYLMILMKTCEVKNEAAIATKIKSFAVCMGHGLTLIFVGMTLFIYIVYLLGL